jgi:hypothetical protein
MNLSAWLCARCCPGVFSQAFRSARREPFHDTTMNPVVNNAKKFCDITGGGSGTGILPV